MYSSTMSYKWLFGGYKMIFKMRSRNYFAQQGKSTILVKFDYLYSIGKD